MLFNTIIWATDGSEAADLALPYVEQLAGDGTRLLVVHCDEFMLAPRSHGYTVRTDEQELDAKIKRQAADLADHGHQVEYKAVDTMAGGAAHRIAEVARDERADLIVVGTRGHTALGGLMVGSVTQRLLHIGTCPVLAVPAVARAAEPKKELSQATG